MYKKIEITITEKQDSYKRDEQKCKESLQKPKRWNKWTVSYKWNEEKNKCSCCIKGGTGSTANGKCSTHTFVALNFEFLFKCVSGCGTWFKSFFTSTFSNVSFLWTKSLWVLGCSLDKRDLGLWVIVTSSVHYFLTYCSPNNDSNLYGKKTRTKEICWSFVVNKILELHRKKVMQFSTK